MEISPPQHKILAALTKFVAICRKHDNIIDISTNVAGDTKQPAFILLRGICRTLLVVHPHHGNFSPSSYKF